MSSPDILAALLPVVEALEVLGVNYQIGGSVASSAHGVPRSTLDVDVVADVGPDHVEPLVRRLSDTYYIDGEMIHEAIRHRSSFNVIHLGTMLKVDLFVVKDRPFDREAFGRATLDTLSEEPGARRLRLTTPEDIVLHKLVWYQLGEEVADRQWRDAVGVLRVQGAAIDLAYLRRWAATIGVEDLLERALAEADPGR